MYTDTDPSMLPTEHSTARRKMGDPVGALKDLDLAIKLDSENAEALTQRGRIKYDSDSFEGEPGAVRPSE